MNIEKVFTTLESSAIVPRLRLHFEPSRIHTMPLTDAESIADFIRELFDQGELGLKEETILLPLDVHMRPICYYRLASGTRTECAIDDTIILMVCMAVGAHGFIVSHNHPDDYAVPSYQDIETAHALRIKSYLLNLKYVDDLVITKESFFSLAENELFWE